MKRLLLLAGLVLFPAETSAAPSGRPISSTGTLEGAPYRIDVPANWNGSLVVYYHGYEVVGEARKDPWPLAAGTQAFLDRGYAVAASGYSRQGWAVEEALADSRRLISLFESRHGRAQRVYAAGMSMGGHVALAALERDPARFDGAVSYCGANLPTRELFADIVANVAGFDAIFPGVLPLGPGGLADPGAPAQLDQSAMTRVEAALAGDAEAAERLAARIGVRPRDLAGAIWLQYAALQEMRSRAGGFPVDNRGTRYTGFGDDAAFNRKVRRYAADPKAAAYLGRVGDLRGRIEDPVVALSNAYDDIVPVRLNARYPALIRRAGRSRFFHALTAVGEGHCNFTLPQVGGAFDALTGWVERGRRP
jgi:pimeloyl-ACP methyl ester carboxylesterase